MKEEKKMTCKAQDAANFVLEHPERSLLAALTPRQSLATFQEASLYGDPSSPWKFSMKGFDHLSISPLPGNDRIPFHLVPLLKGIWGLPQLWMESVGGV